MSVGGDAGGGVKGCCGPTEGDAVGVWGVVWIVV